jgi:D-alanyl-D-alanine carboxypeptidase
VRLLTRALAVAATAATLASPVRAGNEALLLIDAETGKVLQAENATYPWYPASTSKLMTTYVTLQAVKSGRITMDTLLTVSPNAVAQTPSKMGFRAGVTVTVDNALKMLLVHSANDIAVVLAEGVGGSIEKFADEMNATSQRLGMVQSSWVNPNGLPAEGQISSARDLAILARALMHDFPEYDFYWHIPSIRFGSKIMTNYNQLLAGYPGADGMKTGFICSSGFNLVASATRDNRRLIAVVLGASSGAVRTQKAAMMLERGFSNGTGLNWLLPSLGTVDALQPINAAPPDLHEQICGPHHKRPRGENEDDDTAGGGADGDQQRAFQLTDAKGSTKGALLTGNPLAAVPPIVVYTGPKKPTGSGDAEANAAMLKQKKQARKTDKPKTANAKTDKTEAAKNTQPAAPKTAQAKTTQKPKVTPTTQ